MTTVDIHAHVMMPQIEDAVRDEPGRAREAELQAAGMGRTSMDHSRQLMVDRWYRRLTDADERLRHMDSVGIDVHALSISPLQYNYWAAPALAERLCATANAGIAAMCAQRPDRLVGLAHVALQHPALAVRQLTEAMAERCFRGVEISTAINGVDIADPRYDEFWAQAEALGALVFIHPYGCSLGERIDRYYLANVIGQPIETTVALSHLIFGGHLDRFPRLRICAAHGGGYLPLYAGRSDHAYAVRPESRTMARTPSEYLRDIHVDTVVHAPHQVRWLVEALGADRVLLGTDYPFDMGTEDPIGFLRAVPGITEDELAAIAGGNAASLLALELAPGTVP